MFNVQGSRFKVFKVFEGLNGLRFYCLLLCGRCVPSLRSLREIFPFPSKFKTQHSKFNISIMTIASFSLSPKGPIESLLHT